MLTATRARRERGQVVVVFALLIPVIFAMGAIVLDLGNWFVHKRHLQTQVDAAALASGPQFVGCFHDPAAANLAIASRALAFAGDTLRPGQYAPNVALSTTNKQLQQPDDVRVALNASRYWDPPDGMVPGLNGYGLDNTIATPGDPCSTAFLDVKATEEDAPPLWGLIPFTPDPKTHARVKIFDEESARGMLPWAVPEIDPARVAAIFVNEENGVVFDSWYLDPNDDSGLPWSEWDGQDAITFGGVNDRTSVVILISKNDATPSITGLLSDICTQDPGLVRCYAGSGQTSGLSHIHAYDGGAPATLASPAIRDVRLTPFGCGTASLSAPYFTLEGGCTVGVNAVINFGVTGNPTNHPQCARVPGYVWIDDGTPYGVWTGSMVLPTSGDPDDGRQELNISWTSGPKDLSPPNCGNPNQQPNSGSFNVVAAPYVKDSASGPVQYLKLTAQNDPGCTGANVPDANSVEKDDYCYKVQVGLPVPLQVKPYDDPPIPLRMASPSGSQNRAFDCDKNRNYETEIQFGCDTTYIENYVDPDGPSGPAPAQWNNLLCTGWGTGNLPPPTPGPGPPPYPSDCVITETGDKTGPMRQGLAARFESPCVPNNWPDDAAEATAFFGPNGGGYGNDKRYVTLIITDETAFTGSGNEALPIKYFAGFYVTGWDIGGATSGCPDPDGAGPLKGNDCHPIYGCTYNPSKDNGDVWGYFVDIVKFSSEGDPSDVECDFGGAPASCIAALVE